MVRRFVALALLNLAYVCVFAAKPTRVSAEYTYYAPESMSVEEAKRIAVERTKIQALAENFGTRIAQSNTAFVSNNNEISDTYFSSIGISDVKGEWIEDIGQPVIDVSFENHSVVVYCKIEGYAKEITRKDIDFEALTLRNAPNINYASTQFANGDDLFLYFRSPIQGYLNVFLLSKEDDAAFCLLPYKTDPGTSFRIEADKEYILFSKQKNETESLSVDEYTLSTNIAKEFNDLVIIFSPTEFYKSNLKNQKEAAIPKMTSISKFNDWLSKLRVKDDNIVTKYITLVITKK